MVQRLINLQTADYEHPFDKAALDALRGFKYSALQNLAQEALKWGVIKWEVVQLCGSAFHVTDESCPELYQLVTDAARTLEVDNIPEVYTEWTYGINAYTTGYNNNNIMVLFTGAIDLLPNPELTYIIGHELGHIKSGHVLYHLIARSSKQLISQLGPLGGVAKPLELALSYWDRMSEFTADRAGLLACQDLDAALRAIMKMAGLPKKYFDTADPRVFAQQAEEFLSRYGSTADTIIKTISILDDSHPWTVMRAAELIKWVESGEYQKILDGARGKKCPVCGEQISGAATRCPYCQNTNL